MEIFLMGLFCVGFIGVIIHAHIYRNSLIKNMTDNERIKFKDEENHLRYW